MSCIGDCPLPDVSHGPFHSTLIHTSMSGIDQCLFASNIEAMLSSVSLRGALEIAHTSSYHHIEYNVGNICMKRCSWPIPFHIDIIQAQMPRCILHRSYAFVWMFYVLSLQSSLNIHLLRIYLLLHPPTTLTTNHQHNTKRTYIQPTPTLKHQQ